MSKISKTQFIQLNPTWVPSKNLPLIHQVIGNLDQVDLLKEEKTISLQIEVLEEYKKMISHEKKRRSMMAIIQAKNQFTNFKIWLKTKRRSDRVTINPYDKYKQQAAPAVNTNVPLINEWWHNAHKHNCRFHFHEYTFYHGNSWVKLYLVVNCQVDDCYCEWFSFDDTFVYFRIVFLCSYHVWLYFWWYSFWYLWLFCLPFDLLWCNYTF